MAEIRSALKNHTEPWEPSNSIVSNPPQLVKIAPHLLDDVRVLKSLFKPDAPPNWQVRPARSSVAH
jgi:hypothetical protein